MKKSTLKVLSFVMALAMILGTLVTIPFSALPGSNNDAAVATNESHNHTKSGDAIKVEPATCTSYGYSIYECSDCGRTFMTDVTEKTEHNYQEVDGVAPDCATGKVGYTAGVKCLACGEIKSGCVAIEPEHKIAYKLVDAADCTVGVTYQLYCPDCGQIFGDTETIVDYLDLYDDDDHDYTIEIVTAPTCYEDGKLLVVCEREGMYYFDDCAYEGPVAIIIPKFGHDFGETISAAPYNDVKDSFTGEYCENYQVCSRCGAIQKVEDPIIPPPPEDEHVHQWVSKGLVFSYDGTANFFQYSNAYNSADEFLTEYAKYSDISPLDELFVCTDKTCNENRLVRRVDANGLDHLYGNYTFKFEGIVLTLNPDYNPDEEDSEMFISTQFGGVVPNPEYNPEDPESEEYIEIPAFEVTLYGGIYTDYACGEKVTTTKVCAFCNARGIEPGEDDIIEDEEAQEHIYIDKWICYNEECKETKIEIQTVINPDTGEEEEIPVEVEVRPTVLINLEGKGAVKVELPATIEIENPEYDPEDPESEQYLQKPCYVCKDCTHEHVEKVCVNPNGRFELRDDVTVTVVGNTTTTPEDATLIADEDIIPYLESLFTLTIVKEEAVKNFSGIELCMEFEGEFEAKEHTLLKSMTDPGDCHRHPSTYNVCEVCGQHYDIVEDVDHLGNHVFSEWEHIEANCQTEEVTQRYCTVCKANGEDYYEYKDRGAKGDHVWSEWETITEKDCLNQEQKVRVCTICGETDLVTGDKGDHDWVFVTEEYANCVETGIGYYVCSVCGKFGEKLEDDTYQIVEEKVEVEIEVDDENHKGLIRAEITKEPTCQETGVRTYTCEACGYSWVEDMPIVPCEYEGAPEEKATCFTAGRRALQQCKWCKDYAPGNDGKPLDGSEFTLAYRHQYVDENGDVVSYIVEQKNLNGDIEKEITISLNTNDEYFKEKDFALRLRAVKVEEGYNVCKYTIRYVEATCAKEGYVLGKYCTKCAEIYGEDAIFDFEGGYKFTGYRIPKTQDHNYIVLADTELSDLAALCGGKYDFAYSIEYCTICGKYEVNYDVTEIRTGRQHMPTYNNELFEENGALEIVIYNVIDVDGELVELNEQNNKKYPDCTYARGTAKKCRFCGELYDYTETTEEKGHYYIKDGEKLPLVIGCGEGEYDVKYAGLACASCGRVVPEYQKKEIKKGPLAGRSIGVYYTSEAQNEELNNWINEYVFETDSYGTKFATYNEALVERRGYFTIGHEWVSTLDCENATIVACAKCGVIVVNYNEFDEVGTDAHEYLLREGGYDYFDIDYFYDYAFDNVIYPTVDSDGIGTLTCVKCGKKTEKVIPTIAAELTASYNDSKIENLGGYSNYEYVVKDVIVGDEVAVTIKITAKKFQFHKFKLEVNNIANLFELDRVEVEYNFPDLYDAYAYVDEDGNVVVDCANEKGVATIEDAINADFLTLYFKTGDLTEDEACTTIEGENLADAYVADENGYKVDNSFIVMEKAYNFGLLNIYNPNYYNEPSNVLESVFSDGYTVKYDVNKDGMVDISDYFEMIAFKQSQKTIAAFCALTGYDVEAMLDTLEYRDALNKTVTVNTPNGPQTTYRTIENLKDNVRIALERAIYSSAIIDAEITIAQFAQNVIDNI